MSRVLRAVSLRFTTVRTGDAARPEGQLAEVLAGAARMRQVHGARAVAVDGAQPGPAAWPEADALVTARAGLTLAVLVADCLPLLLADQGAGVIGAAHAGRRGLVAGVVGRAVAAMAALGASPARIVTFAGPGAGPCCYEVPAELREELSAAVPPLAATTRWGTPSLDLYAGVDAALGAAGAPPARYDPAACTIHDPRWYSYRRGSGARRGAGLVRLLT